jgi:hypothetical protein
MKLKAVVIGVVLAGCLLGTGCVHHHHHSEPVVVEPEPATGGPVGADPAVDMFYNDLAPYGEWVYVDGPGWVWAPYGIEADWRPYQYGHWVYTDYGWTWASDEDYGWAVYHYGRWHHAPRYGWVWVPGTEWGPAWVAWHSSDDWVGWAPLPYHVRWRAGGGLDWGHSSLHVSIQSGHWSFVATRYMVEPHVHRHVAPRSRNATYINMTRNVTNYTYIDNRVINNGVEVHTVGRAIGRPVHRHHVRQADSPGRTRGGRDDGDDLVIYRPREHPGREPQRRPVPPGHADEQQGKNRGQGLQDRRGRNGHDERPAASRPERGGEPERSQAAQPTTRPQRNRPATDRGAATNPPARGRNDHAGKPRPTEPDEGSSRSNAPRDRSNNAGPNNRPGAEPTDRSKGRDPDTQLQGAPPSSREPRDDARPSASDSRSSKPQQERPAASPPTRSQDQSSQDKGTNGDSTRDDKSPSDDSKEKKPKSGKAKGAQSKPADPEAEEEEEDSGKKGARKSD